MAVRPSPRSARRSRRPVWRRPPRPVAPTIGPNSAASSTPVLSRYGTLRQYLPSFFELPFRAAPGSEPLLQAIEIARALDAGTRGPLTPEDPSDFVPAGWRPYLVEHGKLDRRIWEVALAFATRNALRAGSLFLSESREHVSFWNLIYDSRDWQEHW